MPACSYCNSNVSNNAAFCPECGEPNPAEGSNIVVALVILIAVIAILSPGLLVNFLFGRHHDSPEGLLSFSLSDGFTWIFSIITWASLGIIYLVKRIEK
jgi:hypothetical protein